MSDHFDGRHFFNYGDTKPRGFGGAILWMATRDRGVWRRFRDEAHGDPPPPFVEDMRVTFVNHATVLVQMAGRNVLTDPVWSERVSPVAGVGPRRVRPPGIRFEDLPRIDAVLVSHNHYDHMDLPTLKRLSRRDAPWVLSGLGNRAFLSPRGIAHAADLDWWQTSELGPGFSVTSVPVQHFSGRGTGDRNATLWTGFVVSGSSGDVFFAGDTGYGPHFSRIRERFPRLRLAILPIGAYRPEWFMSPVHQNPEEAIRAQRDLGATTAVGMHFGTFELTDEGEDEPALEIERLLRAAPEPKPRFWVLGFGEGRDVPS